MARSSRHQILKLLPALIVLAFLVVGLLVASGVVQLPTQLSSQAAKERCRVGLQKITKWENNCGRKKARSAQYRCWDGSTGTVGSAQSACLSANDLTKLAREKCGQLSNCSQEETVTSTTEKPFKTTPGSETPTQTPTTPENRGGPVRRSPVNPPSPPPGTESLPASN